MGGLDDLWSASAGSGADIRFIGEYDDEWYGEALPSVFSMGIKSYNPYDDTCTIWNQGNNSQNGAYYGCMGGRTLGDNTLEGGILALYLDGSGNMGFLKGSFDGNLYSDGWMWDGTGEIYPLEIVQATGLDASDLYPHEGGFIRINNPDYVYGYGESYGQFFDGNSYVGSIVCKDWDSKNVGLKTTGTLQIDSLCYDQYFSVTSAIQGGTYAGALDQWRLPFSSSFDCETIKTGGYLLSSPDAAGSWSNNLISGKGVGAWVNLEDMVTGVCGADLKGTFNPVNATWQTAAMWAGMDTRTFLNMAGTEVGKDKLAQLNIPCMEVGSTNLSGSTTDGSLSVNMNNTKFFAYSNGAPPRIWATGDVIGTYTSDPTIGTNVSLTGTGGTCNIYADFGVQKWDTNNWAAGVNGSGTVGGHAIYMTGSAAGQYTGGDFSGTGAGTAQEPTGVQD
jgi:hypothetical protein